jgi:maltooligosyltrehalose trehalohydrolase
MDTEEICHGPRFLGDGRVLFRLWAPSLQAVSLQIGSASPLAMRQEENGWFCLETSAAHGDTYRFLLPDGLAVPDPASRAQASDVHGASILVDHSLYAWKHTAWRNRPWHEAVIYELHAGICGGFAGIQARVKTLAALGVTAIELMPIADFPGRHNWGYDGVLPYAPAHTYGTPDELKALIDASHEAGLMVFLDVVYNHFGPDGAYLHAYAKELFDPKVHTPWGAAIDFKRPQVKSYFIENALMWLNDYHFDGLRFDAVHAIAPETFLPVLAAAIRERADREVHLVLEHEGNDASLLRGPPSKRFDGQWADDWHHCIHVLLTGETEGYYESFAHSPAQHLARAMAEGFVYQGEISPHHGMPRGQFSADLPTTAFVICLQNHDQVGNRAMGERLAALAEPRALAVATTMLLLSPKIPMLFMGEEWGTTTPFLFFTDHNEELAELVRDGRRREFQHFAAFKDEKLREKIPDPNDPATFTASIPDPHEAEKPGHAAILAMYQKLLAIRQADIVQGIPNCRSLGARALSPVAVIGAWRMGDAKILTFAANFGDTAVACETPPGRLLFTSHLDPEPDMLPPLTALCYLADPE